MFAATGSCPDGAKCKLQHRKQKTRKRKSEAIARYTCTPVKLGLLLSMPNTGFIWSNILFYLNFYLSLSVPLSLSSRVEDKSSTIIFEIYIAICF